MVLKALGRVPVKQRGLLLAAAVDQLVPKPRLTEVRTFHGQTEELVQATIAEARRTLRLREGDNTPNARKQLLDFFARGMSEQLLTPRSERHARERLGAKGSLDLEAYQLVFGDYFDREIRKSGIRKSDVREAIKRADAVQHFPLRLEEEPTAELVSLVTVTRDEPTARNTLLVEMMRQKDRLRVSNVWRVFHSDVDLTRARAPLDVLRAFLGVFGLDVVLANRGRARLVEQEAIPLNDLPGNVRLLVQQQQFKQIVTVPDTRPGSPFVITSYFRVSPLGVLEIQLCYAVDTARYLATLRQHGVA